MSAPVITGYTAQIGGTPTPCAKGVADDRDWFARHHGRNHRIRKPIGAEQQLYNPPCGFTSMVVVKQTEPGARVRVPFGWRRGEPLLNAETIAERMFQIAVAGALATIERSR